MKHIVVIGFMGSGKTRVGRKLAEELHLEFVDVDKKIASDMKMSISELMSKFGEPFYRALETKAIKDLMEAPSQLVISVSSGLPMQTQNEKYLKELGTIIYLQASIETLKERLSGDNTRPALKGANLTEKIKKMLSSRAPVYEKLADITVVTGEKTFHDLILEIKGRLEETEKNS